MNEETITMQRMLGELRAAVLMAKPELTLTLTDDMLKVAGVYALYLILTQGALPTPIIFALAVNGGVHDDVVAAALRVKEAAE